MKVYEQSIKLFKDDKISTRVLTVPGLNTSEPPRGVKVALWYNRERFNTMKYIGWCDIKGMKKVEKNSKEFYKDDKEVINPGKNYSFDIAGFRIDTNYYSNEPRYLNIYHINPKQLRTYTLLGKDRRIYDIAMLVYVGVMDESQYSESNDKILHYDLLLKEIEKKSSIDEIESNNRAIMGTAVKYTAFGPYCFCDPKQILSANKVFEGMTKDYQEWVMEVLKPMALAKISSMMERVATEVITLREPLAELQRGEELSGIKLDL